MMVFHTLCGDHSILVMYECTNVPAEKQHDNKYKSTPFKYVLISHGDFKHFN